MPPSKKLAHGDLNHHQTQAEHCVYRYLHRIDTVRATFAAQKKLDPKLAQRTKVGGVASFDSLAFKTLQHAVNYTALLERCLNHTNSEHVSFSMLKDLASEMKQSNQVFNSRISYCFIRLLAGNGCLLQALW